MKVPDISLVILLVFALFQDSCFAHVHGVKNNEYPFCRAKTTYENTWDSIGKCDLKDNVFLGTCRKNYFEFDIMFALVDMKNNVLSYGDNFSSMQSAKHTIHNRTDVKVVAATSIRYICLPEELGSNIGKYVSYIWKVAAVCKSVMRLINNTIVKICI